MTLFSITRLTVERQRRVGELIVPLVKPAKPKAAKPTDAVSARAEEFIRAHEALAGVSLLPKLTIDNVTDRTFAGAFKTLEGVVQTFTEPLKPLTPSAQKKFDAARSLRASAFPAGIGFLSKPMGLQFNAMRDVVRALRSDETAADVKTLGFGDAVDQLEATLGPYGVAVTSPDGADVEKLSEAWHAAFSNLVAALVGSHAPDHSLREGVLGAYQKELDAQTEAAARVRRKKKKAPPTE
jgi:hypothetical protein